APSDAILFQEGVSVKLRLPHIPLYRQSEIYARQGVELSRNTMVRWVSEMADKLRPLYIALNDYVLEAGKVHADDT
ncbi:IS66 family transposase, partial [Shigella flexneri]|uniref:IS66 family transposase n=1 Tax=Shigella flexneri TaxID=623 RepID=UPI000AF33126